MAEGKRFICSSCHRTIEAWSDGNPYYIDRSGRKRYTYHPDHERLAKCIGNDTPHLCLACGKQFNLDSRTPTNKCPDCGAPDIADLYELGGRRCPYCKAGAFVADKRFHVIS